MENLKPLRIVHLATISDRGGMAKSVQNLHQELHKLGHQSMIIDMPSLRKRTFLKYRFLNFLTRITASLLHKKGYSSWNVCGFLKARDIESIKPDILHIHWIGDNLLALSELEKIKVPCVVTFHDFWFCSGFEHNPQKLAQDLPNFENKCRSRKICFLEQSNVRIIFPSQWINNQVFSTFRKHRFKSSIIHNAINTDLFRFQKKSSHDVFRIAIFSPPTSMIHIKGWDIFIELLNKIPESLAHKIHFDIFGFSQHIPQNISVSIKYHGYLDNATAMVALLQQASASLIPSRQESFGLIAAESLCCGTPVICMPNTAHCEMIQHSINGWICDNATSSALISLLTLIVEQNNTIQYEDISAQAIKQFQTKKYLEEHINLYLSLKTCSNH